jgi:hypothetical protein
METKTAMRDDRTDPTTGDQSARAAPPTGGRPPGRRRAVYLNDIRSRAYQKWLAAGGPAGDCARFWEEAEQELLRSE